MAVLAISAIGGAAGFGLGGLVGYAGLGASIGWSIGSYIGNMLFAPKQTVEGPRLADMSVPAGAEGAGIPICYGTVRVKGEVIWSTEIIETKHEEEIDAGKGGGGGATSITYTYSVSFAVGLCEGPITGVRRIWADSKLIYSVSENADPATFIANQERGTIRSYAGTETQTADPTISAAVGAANCPAYRGTAYLVFDTWQLADFGNHRPVIEAEVVVTNDISNPTNTHDLTPDFEVSWMTTDPRRGCMFAIEENMDEGEYVYRWDGGSNDPVPWARMPIDCAAWVSVAIDSTRDEIVAFAGNNGTVDDEKFVRFKASTGEVISSGRYVIASIGNPTDAVVSRGNFHYDPVWECFWGIGEGFSTLGMILIRLVPNDAGELVASAQEVLTGTIGALTNFNSETMIDAEERLWRVVNYGGGVACIKCHPLTPEVFSDPSTVTNPEAAFFWAARDEIWIPRDTGHATFGWRVFNTSTETFDDSVNLGLGSWTTTYNRGVENVDGRAWFMVGSTDLDGTLRDSSGNEVQSFTNLFPATTINAQSMRYQPGVIYIDGNGIFRSFFEYALEQSGIGLDDVVTDICSRAGLTSIDVSDLTADTVRGFIIARPMTARSAIEPLMGAFSFDGMESDGNAVFVKRGGASAATLTYEDMSAVDGDSSEEIVERLTVTRGLETELPAVMYLHFHNIDLDYNIGVARARRLVTQSENVVTLQMPIVFTSEEANQCVDRLMRFSWLERERYEFTLKPRWRGLDPTDVVTLPDGRRVRLTKIDYASNMPLRCEGVSDDDGAINSYAEGNDAETGTGDTLGASGLAIGVILDLPLLRDQDDDEGLYLAARGELEAYSGAVFYVSRDNGNTWVGVTASDGVAKIGTVVGGGLLPNQDGRSWDHLSTLTVRLPSWLTLSSASGLNAFYNGENACAVGVDGEWEVAQFYSVTDNGDDTYTLRNWLRGRKGTEWAIPLHSVRESGTTFVGLEFDRIVRAAFSLNYLDTESLWKTVSFGGSLIDDVAQAQTFQAVSATPLAPCEVAGVREANGDWRIRWTRRARELAEWRNNADVPLDETTEAYELQIYDAWFGSLKSTVTITGSTGYRYASSTASADFGFAPPGLGLKVRQASDRVGYGYRGHGTALTPLLLDALRVSSNFTLANTVTATYSGLTATRSGGANVDIAIANRFFTFGKHYWEVVVHSTGGTNCIALGITNVASLNPIANTIANSQLFMNRADGGDFGTANYTTTYTNGDRVMFAWDVDSGALWIGKNGTWSGSGNPNTGYAPGWTLQTSWSYAPAVWANVTVTDMQATFYFDRGLLYTPPAGYLPIFGETVNDNPRPDFG